jgi:hypothetical protein
VDPIARRVLGQLQDVRTVGEQGTVPFGGVQRGPRIQYRQVGQELDRGLAFVDGERRNPREEIVIGD